jgi:hypothetical protein
MRTGRRLICLCSRCHETTHFGLANITGRTSEAFEQPCVVTGMTREEAWRHVSEAEHLG